MTEKSPRSATSKPFHEVAEERTQRRAFLGQVGFGATVLFVGGCGTSVEPGPLQPFSFEAIPPVATKKDPRTDQLVVPDHHSTTVLLRWGDSLHTDSSPFDLQKQTRESQSGQFGYNCDFVGYLPLSRTKAQSDHGLLVVNHEYTDPTLMFPDFDPEKGRSQKQAEVEQAAHGLSVVEIRQRNGKWEVVRDSRYNRRIMVTTPMRVTGPAASHPFLKTDPHDKELANRKGIWARGTLNNCSGGKTPWGTVLSGEENIQYYFGNLDKVSDPRIKAIHERYGLISQESKYQWETYEIRFDLAKSPLEPFRFGWVVEIDPYDPDSVPRKRTALGRFRHEAATVVRSPDEKIVVYSGDDAKFECIYKFVSKGTYQPGEKNRQRNFDLLDEGTLYVAKFKEDGTGLWMPLVFGANGLTPANGFHSQADVLINTRKAADTVGGTKMDRPEDIEVNPKNQKVYIALTNNTERGTEGKPKPDAMNPRAENRSGHIIELTETRDNHAGTTFEWHLFLVCGNPKEDDSTSFAGAPKSHVSPISCPDNLLFDREGNLWVSTDGAPATIQFNDGLFAVPVDPKKGRGMLQQFLSAPTGSEVCGPELTPDNRTLFVAIQHPGEGEDSTVAKPDSHWPDGGNHVPRPSVVIIQADSGKAIGT